MSKLNPKRLKDLDVADWLVLIIFALVALSLTGCTGVRIGGYREQPQECPAVLKPVLVTYINDPQANEWCYDHGAYTGMLGGCTTCTEYDTHRVCTIRLAGAPNEVGPDALADEMEHALGCEHKGE